MPTVLLIRHGRTAANVGGLLAGRTPGVHLDDLGRQQVAALAARLAPVPLARVVASPLERCQQTAAALLATASASASTASASTASASTAGTGTAGATGGESPAARPALETDARLSECDYGSWTNRLVAELAKEPEWAVVQAHASAAVFPGGESMRAMQARALDAVRQVDAEVAAAHGEHAVWAAVSHGDVIKAVLADALGMHLDAFQRIVVDPASVSVVRYSRLRPFAVRLNDTGGAVTDLLPAPAGEGGGGPSSDAAVGGGAGGGGAAEGDAGAARPAAPAPRG